MDIIVHAKVLRVEEDYLGKSFENIEQKEWVWGPLSLRLDDINRIWGQSKNRCVILLYSGELILVAEAHTDLHERLNVARLDRIDESSSEDPAEEETDIEETEEEEDV